MATAAFTGNKLGLAILWAVLLGAFLKFVLNEGLTRWQLVTGQTLLEGAVHRLGRPVQYIFMPYLLLWSFFVGSALMSACGVAMHAIVPVFSDATQGKIVFGIAHSLLGLLLVHFGGFPLFEKVMSATIAMMFVTVLLTASLICEDWGVVVQGLFIPRIPHLASEGLGWTIALMGGVGGTLTVLCYGYWIREKDRKGPEHLQTCRIDLGVAYAATAIFGIAMVIIGSTIQVEGKGANLIVNLADKLAEPLGDTGKWVFLIGAWGTVFSSLFGVWQAVPYIFADFCGLVRTFGSDGASEVRPIEVDTRGWAYRGYLAAIAIVPMLGLFVSFTQIQKIYAVFGALFMPMLAFVLLILNGRSDWISTRWRNRPSTVAILLATLIVFLLFGYIQLRKTFGF